jgi:hypothetical protein
MLARRHLGESSLAQAQAFGIEEPCPVTDELFAKLLASSQQDVNLIVDNIDPALRATLALYCYRRAHLAQIGLAIAATCPQETLAWWGGAGGNSLFLASREEVLSSSASRRPKITLASGPLRQMGPAFLDSESPAV